MTTTPRTDLLAEKEIAIIGGGPGGLVLARLLQLGGACVTVYERDAGRYSRIQGAIVDLHFDSGLKVIAAAGLTEAFRAAYMPGADRYRVVDNELKMLIDEHTAPGTGFGDPHFRPEIDRGALRSILLDVLAPGTVVWDHQFRAMTEKDGRWELHFKNGRVAVADLVIGADGFRSGVRPYLTPIRAAYSGATIIQGDVEHPETDCPRICALMNRANLIAMGEGMTIAAQPRGDGGLTFYAASLYPENWVRDSGIDFTDAAAVRAYLTDRYRNWDATFHSLFAACDTFVPRPLNCFPPGQHWESRANLTLLGDAAHLMPPSGEGVNTAMLDALDLCEALTGGQHPDLRTAIADYEQKMLARASVLAREALESIQDFAAPSAESVRRLIAQFEQQGTNESGATPGQ